MADTKNTHELLVNTFATADALAKLLIEKGLITQEEFMKKLSAEREPIKSFSILPRNRSDPHSSTPSVSASALVPAAIYMGVIRANPYECEAYF